MTCKSLIEQTTLEPTVTLTANDNWLEFTVRPVVNYKQRRSIKDRLYNCILDNIDVSSDSVSLVSTTFHLVETSVFDACINPYRQHVGEK